MVLNKGMVLINNSLKILINSIDWLIKHWYVPLIIIILIIIIRFLLKELKTQKAKTKEEDPEEDEEDEEDKLDLELRLESPEMEEQEKLSIVG